MSSISRNITNIFTCRNSFEDLELLETLVLGVVALVPLEEPELEGREKPGADGENSHKLGERHNSWENQVVRVVGPAGHQFHSSLSRNERGNSWVTLS